MSTPHGNRTKDVEVDVLEPSAVSCPPVTISTVRGEYTFGSILAVSRAEKACQVGQSGRFATYLCNDSGRWTELNVADCEYVSGVTRTLDQLARVGDVWIAVLGLFCSHGYSFLDFLAMLPP